MATAGGIIQQTRSLAGQLAAARHPALRDDLAHNESLHEDLYPVLWPNHKTPASFARQMLGANPTPALVRHVAVVERRPSLLASAVTRSSFDADVLAALETNPKGLAPQVCDALVEHWEPHLSTPWLEQHAQGGSKSALITWQRPDSTVSDADVAARLASYTAWGDKFDAALVSAVLAARPGVVARLVAVEDLHTSEHSTIRCALASVPHVGGHPDWQRTIVGLDAIAAWGGLVAAKKRTDWHTWCEEMKFTWAAFGATPLADPGVLAELLPVLDVQRADVDLAYRAQRRLDRDEEPMSSYADAREPHQIATLVDYAVPGGRKPGGRPHLYPFLAGCEHLDVDSARRLVEQMVERDKDMRVGRQSRVAVERILQRFPELLEERRIAEELANRGFVFGGPDTPTDHASDHNRLDDPMPMPDNVRDDVADRPVATASGVWWPTAYLDQEMGDDPTAWTAAYEMVATFTGTFAELVMVARSMAA